MRSTFGGVVEEQVSCLAVHFRYLAQVLEAYAKRCPKIDRFVRRLILSDTGVLVEYLQNAMLLKGHFRFTISTWVGLHPRASPTIVAISVLLI